MSMYGSCSLCGQEILEAEARDAHEQVVGWHRRTRSQSTTIKGKLWRKTGAIAHGRCVTEATRKEKAGTSIHQGGLF